MIALLEAHRAGLLQRAHLWRNCVAGVIVGIVALPLAMAFAIASGATPAQGLYTAIVAGLATSLLGGTRVQISGPTGAFIAVLAGVTAQYGIAGLQAATLMAGCILLLMGIARLGTVIKFIPNPVIVVEELQCRPHGDLPRRGVSPYSQPEVQQWLTRFQEVLDQLLAGEHGDSTVAGIVHLS